MEDVRWKLLLPLQENRREKSACSFGFPLFSHLTMICTCEPGGTCAPTVGGHGEVTGVPLQGCTRVFPAARCFLSVRAREERTGRGGEGGVGGGCELCACLLVRKKKNVSNFPPAIFISAETSAQICI